MERASQSPFFEDELGHGTMVVQTILDYCLPLFVICKFLGSNGSGTITDLVSCIQWCIKQKADIINCSAGTFEYSKAMKEAVDQVRVAEILRIEYNNISILSRLF